MKLFRSKAFVAVRGGGGAGAGGGSGAWRRSEQISTTTTIRRKRAAIGAHFHDHHDLGATASTTTPCSSMSRAAPLRAFGNHHCRCRSFHTTSFIWSDTTTTTTTSSQNDSNDDTNINTIAHDPSEPPVVSHAAPREEPPHSNDTATDTDIATPSSWMHSLPGTRTSVSGRQLAIIFTCTVCDTRSAKQFTENAYRHGVVMVQCPGCHNWHLIADRLGYFDNVMEEDDKKKNGQGWDVTSVLAQQGGTTLKDVMELTLEDLVGSEKMKAMLEKDAKSHVEEDHASSWKKTS